MDGDRLVVLG